jgi:hypothetical protein
MTAEPFKDPTQGPKQAYPFSKPSTVPGVGQGPEKILLLPRRRAILESLHKKDRGNGLNLAQRG